MPAPRVQQARELWEMLKVSKMVSLIPFQGFLSQLIFSVLCHPITILFFSIAALGVSNNVLIPRNQVCVFVLGRKLIHAP